MIYTVTLNPALDKTVEIPSLTIDSVNRITCMRTDPGGKGINVSKVISKLGGKSTAVGILGGNTGYSIAAAVKAMGIKTGFLFAEGETRTNMKIVDPVLHTNTDINEPGFEVPKEVTEQLLQNVLGKLTAKDIVVLSGSIPQGCPKTVYRKWISACGKKGARVILDADGEQFAAGLEAGPYLIKPNHHELSALMGRDLNTPIELGRAAHELQKRYGIRKIVVSMGSAGALYVSAGEMIHAEGLRVPVGSTVGAGDSVVAALALAEEKDMVLAEAARLSTATGAANVMCSGSQAAEYETVKELLPKVILHHF
ncbi:MAG: 1-phosphofructokinase [Clostridiales bacterium]|nr:1-phosphofructokinase [Clostridiales bacterium]